VLITFRLDRTLVNQIWGVDPRIDVLYDPQLVGEPRFPCDHAGPVSRTAEEEARWRDWLGRAEVLFGFDRSHPDELPELAPCVRWIQSTSAGVGRYARAHIPEGSDVVITTASGIHATALAEFTLMAMLVFVKNWFRIYEQERRKVWERYTGDTLEGKTVAIVGLGSIGTEVARSSRCFGMRVVGTKRTVEGVEPGSLGVDTIYHPRDMHAMLSVADFVVISCPHTPETEGLIGESELASMKHGSVLINIGRGAIVDELSLIRLLRSGHLGGAALDVTTEEPLPEDSPLWDMPNVLLSAHSGSNVNSENRVLTRLFCDNLHRYLSGRPLRNVLDRTQLY
jgi:phosphoglycerate dehydrogenase-like enzyme